MIYLIRIIILCRAPIVEGMNFLFRIVNRIRNGVSGLSRKALKGTI